MNELQIQHWKGCQVLQSGRQAITYLTDEEIGTKRQVTLRSHNQLGWGEVGGKEAGIQFSKFGINHLVTSLHFRVTLRFSLLRNHLLFISCDRQYLLQQTSMQLLPNKTGTH